MSQATLTKTRMIGGVWEGLLQTPAKTPPQIMVSHQDITVSAVEVIRDDALDGWLVRVPVPVEVLADGVQTFVIQDVDSQEVLNKFSILAGEVLADDIRAEMDLLRAELDLLKRAFRRHCVETA